MIPIAIVDDQRLFRESLGNLIRGLPGFSCICSCGGGEEFLEAIGKEGGSIPQVVLLDLEMPGMNGIELNRILQVRYPVIRVIILTVHAREKLIASLIREGADGYLTKNCDRDELVEALEMVSTQGYYINKMTLQAMRNHARISPAPVRNSAGIPIDLSKRETEVLALICRECRNEEMAAQLYLSPRTVEGHRLNLIQKIGCRNTAGLVLFAVRHGIHPLIS
jgi:two-component system, NarL family, response regulator DegU